ncbi:hypothetical protein [Aureimonas leprariae]|uniref:Uncharacterized protein n=1 Tax=Plantimonas leprariae TaxID=2615207 RepID=A0A7V7PKX0_9HYPH|nr:hypothetical protein [Aureimonas leprariae]KAB0676703.1 hypothetical protein F6X38_20595 [Aureimonas leprariae]
MRPPGNETAIRSAKSDGGDAETICGGFEGKTYGGAFVGSIPSVEHAGRIAMVVRRHDRLYAVDHRPELSQ